MAETVYFGGGGKISLAYAEPGTLTIDVAGSTPKVVVTPNVEFSGTLALTGGLDMTNDVITNIGAAGTDFTATGGLTLADALTVSAGGASITGTLTMGTAVSKIVPGATSWGVRNNADSADNIIITNAGAVTFRSTVGGITTLTATTLAGTLSTAAQTNVTSLGALTALTIAGNLTFSGASRNIIAGTTNFSIRDNADAADNLLITDAGAVTFRSTVGGITTLTATTLAGTLSTAAQANVTSLGTLTALTVDDITINGNTISSAGASTLAITPTAGQAITFDGTVTLDAGVIAGATSITSTTFVGNLTGDASGSAATVTGATQAAITTLANLVTVGALASGSIASGFGAINIGANALTCGAISGTTGTFSAGGYGVTIANNDQPLRIISGSTVGDPYIGIYQTTTLRGYLQYGNAAGLLLSSVAGTVKIYTADTLAATFAVGGGLALVAGLTATTGTFSGAVSATSGTAGLGYGTGAGGTVTQPTSKATAFTLSKVTGRITTAADALAADAIVSATWTNTAIAATDMVVINHVSGGTVGAYVFNVQCGAGTATLNIANRSAGSLSEALVLQFAVLKGVTA